MIDKLNMSERKDVINMSFVGMKICNDGIVAFGDSKSTKFLHGNPIQEVGRGNIQKVFKVTSIYII